MWTSCQKSFGSNPGRWVRILARPPHPCSSALASCLIFFFLTYVYLKTRFRKEREEKEKSSVHWLTPWMGVDRLALGLSITRSRELLPGLPRECGDTVPGPCAGTQAHVRGHSPRPVNRDLDQIWRSQDLNQCLHGLYAGSELLNFLVVPLSRLTNNNVISQL